MVENGTTELLELGFLSVSTVNYRPTTHCLVTDQVRDQ